MFHVKHASFITAHCCETLRASVSPRGAHDLAGTRKRRTEQTHVLQVSIGIVGDGAVGIAALGCLAAVERGREAFGSARRERAARVGEGELEPPALVDDGVPRMSLRGMHAPTLPQWSVDQQQKNRMRCCRVVATRPDRPPRPDRLRPARPLIASSRYWRSTPKTLSPERHVSEPENVSFGRQWVRWAPWNGDVDGSERAAHAQRAVHAKRF